MILLIDNYDSFSYNLYQLVGELDPTVKVIRNDEMTVEELEALHPDRIILSPGPGRPEDAGILIETVLKLGPKIPILGVCLGHQAICAAYGATVTYAKILMHGKSSQAAVDFNCPLFKGCPPMTPVARYHSLAVDAATLPECLTTIAHTEDGEVMGVKHRDYPIYGVQFHPESILTPRGKDMLKNFIALSKEGAELIQQTGEDGTEEGAAQQGAGSDAQQAGDATDADEDGFPDNAYDILMIGDSVSLRTVDTFNNTFTHGHIDAAKNRQFAAGKGIFLDYAQQNLAGRIVVFALGTNGPVTDDAIDSLMEVVGPDRICVFITTRSPRQWVQSTNDALKRAAERYENVRVIDWYAYSEGRNDLFDGDGTHLSSTGAQEYIALVNNEVKNDLPFHFEGATRDTTVQAVIAQAQKTCEQAGAVVFGSHSDAS